MIADPAVDAANRCTGLGWRIPLTANPYASGQISAWPCTQPGSSEWKLQMANMVRLFAPPRPFMDARLRPGHWRPPLRWLDLALRPGCDQRSETEVMLSYDWSEVPEDVRRTGPNFPPFPPEHLDSSLNIWPS